MNRINYVDGFCPRAEHFNATQEAAELGDAHLARTIIGEGIVSGLNVDLANLQVTPGLAYDKQGRVLELRTPFEIDLDALNRFRPPDGKRKWVALAMAFTRNKYEEVWDDKNTLHKLHHDDAVEITLVEGGEVDENAPNPPPLVGADHLVLGDILWDPGKSPENLTVSKTRRVSSGLTTEQSILAKAVRDASNHRANENNPHQVSKAQVGLGNVPNWRAGDSASLGSSSDAFSTEKAIRNYVEKLFPIGMILAFTTNTNPASLGYPGTWAALPADVYLAQSGNRFAGGNSYNPGLPNITGELKDLMDTAAFMTNRSGGALYTMIYDGAYPQSGSRETGYYDGIGFDASRSNSLYGAATTVQPQTYGVYYFKRSG